MAHRRHWQTRVVAVDQARAVRRPDSHCRRAHAISPDAAGLRRGQSANGARGRPGRLAPATLRAGIGAVRRNRETTSVGQREPRCGRREPVRASTSSRHKVSRMNQAGAVARGAIALDSSVGQSAPKLRRRPAGEVAKGSASTPGRSPSLAPAIVGSRPGTTARAARGILHRVTSSEGRRQLPGGRQQRRRAKCDDMPEDVPARLHGTSLGHAPIGRVISGLRGLPGTAPPT